MKIGGTPLGLRFAVALTGALALVALPRCGGSSPPLTGTCPGKGFSCHAGADTCASSDDCCGDGAKPAVCGYQPALGHWACAAVTVCNG